MPRDTSAQSAYYLRLQSLNLVREFGLSYYQDHKEELDALRFEQFRPASASAMRSCRNWPKWRPKMACRPTPRTCVAAPNYFVIN